MVEAIKDYLSRFVALSDEDFGAFSLFTEVRHYDKKVIVVNVGEEEQYINFIVRGLVRKYFLKGTEEIITQIAREKEIINSSVSFITGKPSDYIVETIEPTMFISIRKDSLEDLYKTDKKWQKLARLIITDVLLQKDLWELDRIRYSTKERFIRFLTANPDLFQRVPQKYLASYLHIQPETFSRLKHLLKKSV
jgi:CRP-like cAMP-binding protein